MLEYNFEIRFRVDVPLSPRQSAVSPLDTGLKRQVPVFNVHLLQCLDVLTDEGDGNS